MDITAPVAALGAALVAAVGTAFIWLMKVKVIPWLKKNKMERLIEMLPQLAKVAVLAAEVAWGRGNGAEKWEMALKKLEFYGFTIDDNRVIDALEAAWKELDLMQIMAGEKEAT